SGCERSEHRGLVVNRKVASGQTVDDLAKFIEIVNVDGAGQRTIPGADKSAHRLVGSVLEQSGKNVRPVVEIHRTFDAPFPSRIDVENVDFFGGEPDPLQPFVS